MATKGRKTDWGFQNGTIMKYPCEDSVKFRKTITIFVNSCLSKPENEVASFSVQAKVVRFFNNLIISFLMIFYFKRESYHESMSYFPQKKRMKITGNSLRGSPIIDRTVLANY